MRLPALVLLVTACRDPRPEPGTGSRPDSAEDSSSTGVSTTGETGEAPATLRIVFVSRQIPDRGTVHWDVPRDLVGVGPHSRVRPAAPGRLQVLEQDGSVTTLVDGAAPEPPFSLIDVNAPTVSYDGRTIVFAGLGVGSWPDDPARSIGGWRLYAIDADGGNLRAVTTSDQELDYTQFGEAAAGLQGYDDIDPQFLPDGRVVFSSTRWPAFAQYAGVRASQLYVVSQDGTGLHRITSERNGADRPLVDPVTGKIVYARWWRNVRLPIEDRSTVFANGSDASGGYLQKDGLTTDVAAAVGGAQMARNAWHAATINTDGGGLAMFTGVLRDEDANLAYGGAFAPDGTLYANYFPTHDLTDAAGFGGIRRYLRGPEPYVPVLGVTAPGAELVSEDPPSLGVFPGPYAVDPEVLPSGDLVVSLAQGVDQDYGLYTVAPDGSGLTPLFDAPGTAELRARVIAPKPLPPPFYEIHDPLANEVPIPDANGPYDAYGTFTFGALNIFFNAPVDFDIVSAPAIGSVKTIRFFLDQQRTSPGSSPALDWPIELGEVAVDANGAVTDGYAPAGVPLFEQLRGPNDEIPLTPPEGAGHVTGMNFGIPDGFALCVGCHAGHSMIPSIPDHSETRWTNLAPGAAVTVSSSRDPSRDGAVVDRRAAKGLAHDPWTTAPGATEDQWVELRFLVPIRIQAVRLWDPRPDSSSTLHVDQSTVELVDDQGEVVAASASGPLSAGGTDVPFAQEPIARVVRVRLDAVSGTFDGEPCAGLAEIEVVGQGVL